VGQIVKTLKAQGIFDNTLIIITSDNGPMVKEGYIDGALEHIGSHDPVGGLRGAKYSLYEGGTRMPFVVSWPKKIKHAFIQNQSFCFMDMLATLADLTKARANKNSFNDSKSAARLFLKAETKAYRQYVITQNNSGDIAMHKGDWKYIPAYKKEPAQLYNLKTDYKEQNNVVKLTNLKSLVQEFEQKVRQLKQ